MLLLVSGNNAMKGSNFVLLLGWLNDWFFGKKLTLKLKLKLHYYYRIKKNALFRKKYFSAFWSLQSTLTSQLPLPYSVVIFIKIIILRFFPYGKRKNCSHLIIIGRVDEFPWFLSGMFVQLLVIFSLKLYTIGWTFMQPKNDSKTAKKRNVLEHNGGI